MFLKGGEVVGYALIFILGVIFGGILVHTIKKEDIVGDLRIDTSDPDDGPYMFLELNRSVMSIYNEKLVTLRVNTQNYISRK